MRLGDWAWGSGERGEDLQLASLLFWLEWPAGSQGMPTEVGDKPHTRLHGEGERLL